MNTLLQDLRYGLRMLLKQKGLSAVALLSLALGIGANTALFSIVDAMLLKMLPVKEPDRLVLFEWEAGRPFRTSGRRGSGMRRPEGVQGGSVFRHDIVEKMREARAKTPGPISELFAFAPTYDVTAASGDRAEIVHGQVVSGGVAAARQAVADRLEAIGF